MGSAISRSSAEPRALYFGPHFVLRRPEAGQLTAEPTEQFRGLLSDFHVDWNTLANWERTRAPAILSPGVIDAPSVPLECPFNIRRGTFSVVGQKLCFVIDALCAGSLHVHWGATEAAEGFDVRGPTVVTEIAVGLSQSVSVDILDAAALGELPSNTNLVIVAVGERQESAQRLATFLAFDAADVRVVKQKIWVGSRGYLLQEIYDDSQPSDSPQHECIVCLAEEKDTIVLPCRHMCLCKECALLLRRQSRKCPICRQEFHSLLHLSSFKALDGSPAKPTCTLSLFPST